MTHPCSLVYSEDMRKFTWKYTQFTQFNKTDKLLLVSGVHFGSHSTSGEIVIFNMEGRAINFIWSQGLVQVKLCQMMALGNILSGLYLSNSELREVLDISFDLVSVTLHLEYMAYM